jgi:hypothetical protein
LTKNIIIELDCGEIFLRLAAGFGGMLGIQYATGGTGTNA